MRTGDVAPPTLTPHVLPPGSPIATWPYRPVIALEQLPQPAYTWDDYDTAVVWDAYTSVGYLTPTVGTVTTPDPGPLPAECTFVFKVRGPQADAGAKTMAFQWGDPQSSFLLYRDAGPSGAVGWIPSPTGSGGALEWIPAAPTDKLNPQTVALSVGQSTGLRRTHHYANGVWSVLSSTTGPVGALFDSSLPVQIGGPDYDDRIYSVELRTGLDPAAGTVVWRFDANDYPGTGTSYVDPRGRTWTMSTPGAITPGVAAYVYDAPFIGGGFTDASCDFHGVDIDPGDADDLYLFPATECTVTLDNRTGAYTPWSPDGRLVYWAPGRRLHVWVVDDASTVTWLFSGRVASWVMNADDTVTVTAHDGLAWLAQELGGPWTPGAAGQSVGARMNAIMTAAGYPDRVDVEAGTVTLTAPTLEADTSPLMAAQRVALSDGGLFYGDADGSLDYRNRLWRAGRPDQTVTWAVSDNVCTVPVVVWDAELAADDERLVTDVRLVNTADLVATATATGSLWAGDARYRLAHPDPDQWSTQAEGNALAAYLLAQQGTPSMAMSRFSLYVQDPTQQPEVWAMAVGTRRGDRVEVLHAYPDPQGDPAILDTWAIVLGVTHSITPEQWVADVALSRTVDYRLIEQWDRTVYTFDDPAPANVWRY